MSPDILIWLVILLAFGGFVVLVRTVFRVEPPAPMHVSAAPAAAVDAATGFMATRGFTISHKGETSATFARPKKPSTDVGCLLLLLGVIPGLLYFGLFRGTQTTSVLATSGPAGTTLTVSGDDARGRRDLEGWARETLTGDTGVPPAASIDAAVVGNGDASATGQRRRYCANCGAEFDEGARFCASCGATRP